MACRPDVHMHPALAVTVGRNRFMSVEIASFLVLALFQLWLMDGTVHPYLSEEIE